MLLEVRICVLILLYKCPHTTIYVSSYCYTCAFILLYMCPHTTIHVSSYCYTRASYCLKARNILILSGVLCSYVCVVQLLASQRTCFLSFLILYIYVWIYIAHTYLYVLKLFCWIALQIATAVCVLILVYI